MTHPGERLEERFNVLEFDKKMLKELNNNIQGIINNIPCIFIKKKSNRLSEWLILVNNRWTICYYDKRKNTIVTFVDNKNLNNYELIERCINIWMSKTVLA